MVLDRLDSHEPLIGQETLQRFRERLIEHTLDQRLLERIVDTAKDSGVFRLEADSQEHQSAMDSRPFEGAGRVEDTFNLLGHAARKLAAIAALLGGCPLLGKQFVDFGLRMRAYLQ